jgi:hypothetical protein
VRIPVTHPMLQREAGLLITRTAASTEHRTQQCILRLHDQKLAVAPTSLARTRHNEVDGLRRNMVLHVPATSATKMPISTTIYSACWLTQRLSLDQRSTLVSSWGTNREFPDREKPGAQISESTAQLVFNTAGERLSTFLAPVGRPIAKSGSYRLAGKVSRYQRHCRGVQKNERCHIVIVT